MLKIQNRQPHRENEVWWWIVRTFFLFLIQKSRIYKNDLLLTNLNFRPRQTRSKWRVYSLTGKDDYDYDNDDLAIRYKSQGKYILNTC